MIDPSTQTLTLGDLLHPATLADPYPFYHRLREADPVHWDPAGFWVLTRYADVLQALHDPRFSAARITPGIRRLPQAMREALQPLGALLPRLLIYLDPPDHTRLRGLVTKALTPRVVEAMRPQIAALVDGLLDRVAAGGQMNIVDDLAYPLPATVIATLLGVPAADRDQFRVWSDDFARFLGNLTILTPDQITHIVASIGAFTEYFQRHVAARRGHPQDDLLQALLQAEEQGDTLSTDELIANCMLLLGAGHITTIDLIANGLLTLLRHPAQRQRLQADPALIAPAVEELLRYESPVQLTARILQEDVEIGGTRIRRRHIIQLALGAANRDPARFPDPDRLDLTRADNRHLAFGYAAHYCLGAPLARLEAQLAIGTVLRRMPALHLAPGDIGWQENLGFRSLKGLRVTF